MLHESCAAELILSEEFVEDDTVHEQIAQLDQVASGTGHRGKFLAELFDLIKNLVVLVAIALTLRASVVEAFKIPSSSMEPTLQIGDHILVNKLSYGLHFLFFQQRSLWQYATPSRGDIVVFTRPDDPETSEDETDTNLIKRVVGVPGDLIKVEGAKVFINGVVQDEPFARWLSGGSKDFGPITVPAGRIFLMGDNRDFSKDSRFWDNPFLEIERVKGRAFIIYWNSRGYLNRMLRIVR